MATKLANNGGPNPHTAGIFADMTVDGPEIGTLVLVVDRAKNLPNRKTMGKQNPYCAARLGKEAKKTETDRRGGQTPRWDQEIRFTVHDSPDYYNLKISIFSEDKRTDLIGEAWISLSDIIGPGGGKKDFWQGMNCKGKYAGELRVELTYYDSRPKPERTPEDVLVPEDLRQSMSNGASRVRRRPLPSNPNSGHITPDSITPLGPPGRAKHGPRDIRMPPRANSMPPEGVVQHQHQASYGFPAPMHQSQSSSPAQQLHQQSPTQYYGEQDSYDEPQEYGDAEDESHQMPDFLPQLPPSNSRRGLFPSQPPHASGRGLPMPHTRPQSHIGIPHSYSAPVVPHVHQEPQEYDQDYQLRTDYPEAIPDLDYQHQQLETRPRSRRRSEVLPDWQNEYDDPYANGQYQIEDSPAPPPPPMHTHSAPIVPQYNSPRGQPTSSPLGHGATPPSARHYSVPSIPNSSPLQSIERKYATPRQSPGHGHPARGASMDSHMPSPEQRSFESSPSFPPGQTPSPYARPQPSIRPLPPHRLSTTEPYGTNTPPRPHPLSQEVPRPRSPNPQQMPIYHDSSPHPNGQSPYQGDYRSRDAAPPMPPRAVSPRPGHPSSTPNSAQRPRSSYNIQFPVRAFESSDSNPLSTSRPPSNQPTPSRKSITSQSPSTVGASPTIPFSPDSFNVHNPNAHQSTLPTGSSPHAPYQFRPGPQAAPHESANGPIVGWHGREIDPSDHLPVDSWAPEPERKNPTKTYGLGREREFGPRSAQGTPNSARRNLSKDTVVNVRMKSQSMSQPASPLPQAESESSPLRNRLQKKNTPNKSPIMEPLRERHNYNSVSVPDPYAQQQYSRGFHQQSPVDNGYQGYGTPPGHSPTDALSREISNISIGSGRNSRAGGVPSPIAYVPVRSHKDRNTFY